MTLNWNPNSPNKKGIEVLDVGYGHQPINAPNAIGLLYWDAIRSGQIDDFQVFTATSGNVAPRLDDRYNGLQKPLIAELIPQSSLISSAITYVDYNVSTVTGGAGMINENFSTPINANRLSASNDGLFIACGTLGGAFNASFASGAFPLDRHVVGVEVQMRVNLTTGVRRIDPIGYSQSPWYYNVPVFSPGAIPASVRMGELYVEGNGTSWKHWTPQNIREFATTRGIRISCQAGPGYWRMDRLFIRVWYMTERRRGVGIGIPANGTWVNFDMLVPSATGTPSVTAGEDMAWVVRRMVDYSVDQVANASMPWRVLRGRLPVYANWRRRFATWNPNVGLSALGDYFVDGIPTVRTLDNGTVEDDTMPYHVSRGVHVYDGQNASQYITIPAGTTIYGQVYAVAGWYSSGGFPENPLRCEVYRVSDGERVFDPIEITADEASQLPRSAPYSNVDDENTVYKTLRFRFEESLDLTAGSYEVRFSSPDTTFDRKWHIAALIAFDDADNQTYGEGTEYAVGEMNITGTPTSVQAGHTADLLVEIVDVPAAVTGVATAEGSLTVHHAEICNGSSSCDGCADETLPYTVLTWNAAPTGNPDIEGYHVDRQDDISTEWERVAYIHGRTNTTWRDHEARIGVPTRYRVRVIRTDDVTGDWSSSASIVISSGQIALGFSSNSATGMGLVYPEIWDGDQSTRNWTFEEADDIQFGAIFGRNKQVAFRPLERKGDSFSRTLLVNALCSVTAPTMNLFQPLRDLAWAPIPYVCVRDGEGNRWFASLQVESGTAINPDNRWFAEITITEVAGEASIFDSDSSDVLGVVDVDDAL